MVRPQPTFLISLMMVAVLLHAADATLMATLSPSIVRDIGGLRLLPWGVALYETGSIIASAASALLALRYGLGKPMTSAAILFGVGCLISAAAPQMEILLIGRTMQGMGGGCMVALSFVSVTTLFPMSLIPKALALISTVWGISAFFGPLIGGLFVEAGSWRGAFAFFSLVAAAVALGSYRALAGHATQINSSIPRVPVRRLVWLALGVLLIASAGVETQGAQVPILLLMGTAALARFFILDKNSGDARMLPVQSIGFSTPVGAGLLMILLFASATIGLSIYGPLLLSEIHQVKALTAGYVIACSSIGWSIAAVVTSTIKERQDKIMIAAGMIMLFLTIPCFLFWLPRGPIWLIAVIAIFEGAGFGLAWAFILRRLTRLVDQSDHERIASAIATIHRLGYAIGAALMGIVANASGLSIHSDFNFQVTSNWLFSISSVIALIGLIATWKFLRPTLDK